MKNNFRARGFSLVELLCVAVALCVLLGASAVAFLGDGDERRIVREEAEDLRSWLADRMAFAAREGANFKLFPVDHNDNKYELRLEWSGGSKDLERETFAASRADMGLSGGYGEHTFDGEWFTLTPAASFIIRSRKDSSIRLIVSVSAAGYADVKETVEGQ